MSLLLLPGRFLVSRAGRARGVGRGTSPGWAWAMGRIYRLISKDKIDAGSVRRIDQEVRGTVCLVGIDGLNDIRLGLVLDRSGDDDSSDTDLNLTDRAFGL